MKTNLPMAIEPSIPFNKCQFKLFKVDKNSLFCKDLLVEVNHKLIDCTIAYFLGLDITKVEAMAVTNIDLNYAYARNRMFGLTLEQVQHLFATTHNAVANKYKPILSELIVTQILSLFNGHDKKEIITMSTKLSTQNNSQKFHNDLFGDLTVLTHEDGSLWFIGKEVAEKLGYARPNDAITQHCKHTVKHRIKLNQNDTRGSDMLIIPESDLYRLVMRSKLPDAEKFEDWVVSEILPSIRKTGGYGQPQVEQKAVKPKNVTGNAALVKLILSEVNTMNLSDSSKQVLKAHLFHDQAGLPLDVMLPKTEHKLSAEEIGKLIGVSSQMVGRIITELGIRDDPKLCERRLGKSPHSVKQVEQFFYNPDVVEMVKQRLLERKSA